MTVNPTFFVPLVSEEKHEECYQALAKDAGVAAAPLGKRIYSIKFRHNGEVWTATVGQSLVGTAEKTVRVRGQKVERTLHLSNPAVVMAIYEGYPYIVWHDNRSRTWANPFMAGEPFSVTHFAA
ncbi:hypothetical protein [Brevundimonas sp. UBA7838]|uniref:hypothetical protein n=1 Tax=Brevundimonas sp. UBA7838 TaxID=1946142 RepID=UPI0025C6CE54|nr:hypothetical protein [Brevundimonas sp. UBA7838]